MSQHRCAFGFPLLMVRVLIPFNITAQMYLWVSLADGVSPGPFNITWCAKAYARRCVCSGLLEYLRVLLGHKAKDVDVLRDLVSDCCQAMPNRK